MAKIGRLWAGKLYGTNTGNLSATFSNLEDETGFDGEIRFMDDRFGPVVYAVTGTFDGTILLFEGDAIQQPDNVQTGSVQGKATLTQDGNLRGEWSTKLGTGGTFILLPHDSAAPTATQTNALPEQLHTAVRTVGAVRLYPNDVRELIGVLRKDFTVGRVIVNYNENGNEISKYAKDFEQEFGRLKELRYLRIHVQEPEAHDILKVATIELNANSNNVVRVQGIQEAWVIGKAEALTHAVRKYQKFFPTTFQKYGLNINTLLGAVAVVLLPELPLTRRFVFVGAVAAIMYIYVQIYRRYIPNALVHLSAPEPGLMARAAPQVFSTLLAISSGVITAVIYGILKGEISIPATWLVFR